MKVYKNKIKIVFSLSVLLSLAAGPLPLTGIVSFYRPVRGHTFACLSPQLRINTVFFNKYLQFPPAFNYWHIDTFNDTLITITLSPLEPAFPGSSRWMLEFYNKAGENLGYYSFSIYDGALETDNLFIVPGHRGNNFSYIFTGVLLELAKRKFIPVSHNTLKTSTVFLPQRANALIKMGFIPEPGLKGATCFLEKKAKGRVLVFFPDPKSRNSFRRRMKDKSNALAYKMYEVVEQKPSAAIKVTLEVPYVIVLGSREHLADTPAINAPPMSKASFYPSLPHDDLGRKSASPDGRNVESSV